MTRGRARRCFRTLDRPLEFFGLEVEDWGVLLAVAGAAVFVAGAVAGTAVGAAGWVALRRLKSGNSLRPPPVAALEVLLRSGRLQRKIRTEGGNLITPMVPFPLSAQRRDS